MRALWSRRPGVTTVYHENPDQPGFVLEKIFDREPVLDHCQTMRNEVVQRGEMRKVASVPTPLFFKWLQEGKLNDCFMDDGSLVVDQKKLAQLLNDPDYQNLKCIDGQV